MRRSERIFWRIAYHTATTALILLFMYGLAFFNNVHLVDDVFMLAFMLSVIMLPEFDDDIKREERKRIIRELERIEKFGHSENPEYQELHCSCLGYSIFKLKCDCDDECGKCKIN